MYGVLENVSLESDVMLQIQCLIAQASSSCLNPAVYAFLALNFGKTASSFAAAVFHVACIFVLVAIVVQIECNLSKTPFTRTNVTSYPTLRQPNRLHQLNVSDALT